MGCGCSRKLHCADVYTVAIPMFGACVCGSAMAGAVWYEQYGTINTMVRPIWYDKYGTTSMVEAVWDVQNAKGKDLQR